MLLCRQCGVPRRRGAGAAGPAVPPAPPGSLPPPPPGVPLQPQYDYHLSVAGQTYGPYSFALLQQYAQSGHVTRDSLLWREGLANWNRPHNWPSWPGCSRRPSLPPRWHRRRR